MTIRDLKIGDRFFKTCGCAYQLTYYDPGFGGWSLFLRSCGPDHAASCFTWDYEEKDFSDFDGFRTMLEGSFGEKVEGYDHRAPTSDHPYYVSKGPVW